MTFNPTAEQTAIIAAAKGTQDLMIVARAGCAKTTTIKLLVPSLPTQSVLALAFNKKNALDLKAELPPYVQSKTLNALGYKAWWQFLGRKEMTVDTKKNYQVIQTICGKQNISLSKEEKSMLADLLNAGRALGFMPKGSPIPGLSIVRDDEDGIETIFDWADVDYRQDLEVLFRAGMVEHIRQGLAGTIDFNDQIYLPVVFSAPFDRFDTVVVDEAQDLSDLNHRMIKRACAKRMIMVGDDKQAIYAFRGALSDSMGKLAAMRDFQFLPLTMTFRCGKAIVARAQDYVPDFVASPGNSEGSVEDWTKEGPHHNDADSHIEWHARDIPAHSAVICRNNAPLIKLAFKLLRQGRGVQMLGNDIGKSLERALDLAAKGLSPDTPSPTVLAAVEAWFKKEISKAKTDRKIESLEDRWECVAAIVEEAADLRGARNLCHKLFEDAAAVVTLSSGHKAKGLEWDSVIHLDPFRIPSRYAHSPEALTQESNLRYVIETRARHRLILANLEDFE